jgi:hypothetical protein
MADTDIAQPYPTIAIVDYGSTPNSNIPLELGRPPPNTVTYLFRLFPQLDGEGMSIVAGKGTLPDEIPDDLVAALRT